MAKKLQDNTLHGLLILKLQALLDIETQLTKALPKMAKKAKNPELKKGFELHFQQTKQQVLRLGQAFESLGEKPQKTKVEAIRGLIKDADWLMKNIKTTQALDASLIAAAQYVEHYEMAGYGTAKEWAKLMGHTEVEQLLSETLEEEKMTDEKLNNLAISKVNENVDMGM